MRGWEGSNRPEGPTGHTLHSHRPLGISNQCMAPTRVRCSLRQQAILSQMLELRR